MKNSMNFKIALEMKKSKALRNLKKASLKKQIKSLRTKGFSDVRTTWYINYSVCA